MSDHNISIIGCGKMGSALAKRLASDHNLHLFDRNIERTSNLAKSLNAKAYSSALEAINKSEVVILAVKPKDLELLSSEIRNEVANKKLLVSTLGGISSKGIRPLFDTVPLLMMMPNIPVETGSGVIGLAETEEITPKTKTLVNSLFKNLGSLHWIPESKMNALASLSGTGPAYLCIIIESIIDAAIHMGFSADEGKKIALEMVAGTATMLLKTGEHPAEAKWRVASPGGTTIRGIATLEDHNVRSGIINTFLSAYH